MSIPSDLPENRRAPAATPELRAPRWPHNGRASGASIFAPPAADSRKRRRAAAAVETAATANRLQSLDAFRGLTILLMLLVNNVALGAQTPDMLRHADWRPGLRLADFVFPWFLLIVGVAMPYAEAGAHRRRVSTGRVYLRAVVRSGMLVGIGCLIDSFVAHRPLFDLGVLQLIGLAYLAAFFIAAMFYLPGRLLSAALLLAVHWAVLKGVATPHAAAGVFTERHNVPAYLNAYYLGQYHLKGLLSVVPTTALVLIGTVVGDTLRGEKRGAAQKIGVLGAVGLALIALGWLGSSTIMNEALRLPLNKPCWTPPYILYTGGWGCLALAAFYAVIDALPGRWGAYAAFPLIVAGMNAIAAYALPVLTKVAVLRNIRVAGPAGAGPATVNLEEAIRLWFYAAFGHRAGGWAYTLAYMACWWCVLLFLYRRRWFLRV